MLTINQRKRLAKAFEEWCDEADMFECAESAASFFSQFCDEKKVNVYLADREILKNKEEKTND